MEVEIEQHGAETYAIPEPNFDANPFGPATVDDDAGGGGDGAPGEAEDAWAALLSACAALRGLRGLSLGARNLAPVQADGLPALSALTRLEVRPSEWCSWDGDRSSSEAEFVPARLDGLWAATQLRRLALVGARRGATHRLALSAADAACAARLARLEELRVERFEIECDGDPRLGALAAAPGLRRLALRHGMLYRTCDAALGGLSALTALARLDLSYLRVESLSGAAPFLELRALRSLPALSDLDLTGSSFLTDAGMSFLASCAPRALRRLGAGGGDRHAAAAARHLAPAPGAGVTDEGLAALAGLSQLTSLDVSWNPGVTWSGVAALGPLRGLRELDLGNCSLFGARDPGDHGALGDRGAGQERCRAAALALAGLTRLGRLSLAWTAGSGGAPARAGDAGAESRATLRALAGAGALRHLDVTGLLGERGPWGEGGDALRRWRDAVAGGAWPGLRALVTGRVGPGGAGPGPPAPWGGLSPAAPCPLHAPRDGDGRGGYASLGPSDAGCESTCVWTLDGQPPPR